VIIHVWQVCLLCSWFTPSTMHSQVLCADVVVSWLLSTVKKRSDRTRRDATRRCSSTARITTAKCDFPSGAMRSVNRLIEIDVLACWRFRAAPRLVSKHLYYLSITHVLWCHSECTLTVLVFEFVAVAAVVVVRCPSRLTRIVNVWILHDSHCYGVTTVNQIRRRMWHSCILFINL